MERSFCSLTSVFSAWKAEGPQREPLLNRAYCIAISCLSADFSEVPFYWRELINSTATNDLPMLSLDCKEYMNVLSHLKVSKCAPTVARFN